MDPRTVLPEGFAWQEWWQPLRSGRPWFFHTPRQMVAAPSLRVDYDTLDVGVAGLVGKLHGMGIPTWPSCEGHWFEPTLARDMYAQLLVDERAIRHRGLHFKHTETGKRVVYYNPTWTLPWAGEHSFFLDVSRGNGAGLVAFSPPAGHPLWSRFPRVEGACPRFGQIGLHPAVLLQVRTANPSAQRRCWEAVTRKL